MNVRAAVGRYGENVAVGYLEGLGFRIIERNWRCRAGELDIVAEDGDCLVVCEVKTRRSEAFGPPHAAVTASKLARLRRLTAQWLAEQERHWPAVRLDVVAVRPRPSGPALIEHLRAVG
jgi:putative endonuclease